MPSADPLFGVHADALRLRARRAEVLAGNLANADTPGYKARDVDFRAVLADAGAGLRLQTTDPRHLQPAGTATDPTLAYRVPNQPSIDGNTVETHVEEAEFAKNAMQYQASLQFITARIAGIRSALRGE
ncbi:MAG: flagellar basal body rod protein FlgB [Gammaproteobacteria bacterium]